MSTANFVGQEIAVVAINRRGAELGRRLSAEFPGSQVFLPAEFAAAGRADEHPFSLPAGPTVREAFKRYRYLVLIMAMGIAVRLVAAELKDKRHDPGVVVVDSAGKFAVSLLSGHIGGANALAAEIASRLGAQPVITTASESAGTIPADLLGREFGWTIEDKSVLKAVGAALVDAEPVAVYQDAGERDWLPGQRLPSNIRVYNSLESLHESCPAAALVVTDRVLSETEISFLPAHTAIYRPRSLVVGIGCNRGTSRGDIEAAVAQTFSQIGLCIKSIRTIATIDLKKSEAGILEFAAAHGALVEFHTKEALAKADFTSPPSDLVQAHVGTPSVCEAAAILSAAGAPLLVPKTAFRRAVTVAISRLDFPEVDRTPRGKLFLVGLGPGSPEQMTHAARNTLDQSQVIVGYDSYVKSLAPLLRRQKIITTGMTEEVERAQAALRSARQGNCVSLVCSGDSGIYGMAGLVGEILSGQEDPLDVEMVPGVTSLTACAALLGAPLNGDFASISLSDYLVPWSQIARRLDLAAQGDFVVVLYNPSSRSRGRHLAEARDILLRARAPETPVGIVTNAYRHGQQVAVSDLGHLLDNEVGMNTTIIVGNSGTFRTGNRMVTPRGYSGKYDLTAGPEGAAGT